MALRLKDPETIRWARKLAQLNGETITEAVTIAIRERIELLNQAKAQSGERLSNEPEHQG